MLSVQFLFFLLFLLIRWWEGGCGCIMVRDDHLTQRTRTCLLRWAGSRSLSTTSRWCCWLRLSCWWSGSLDSSWSCIVTLLGGKGWGGYWMSRGCGRGAHSSLRWGSACCDSSLLITYSDCMLCVLDRLLWSNLLFRYKLLSWHNHFLVRNCLIVDIIMRNHLFWHCLMLLLRDWLDLSNQ